MLVFVPVHLIKPFDALVSLFSCCCHGSLIARRRHRRQISSLRSLLPKSHVEQSWLQTRPSQPFPLRQSMLLGHPRLPLRLFRLPDQLLCRQKYQRALTQDSLMLSSKRRTSRHPSLLPRPTPSSSKPFPPPYRAQLRARAQASPTDLPVNQLRRLNHPAQAVVACHAPTTLTSLRLPL